MGAFLGFAVIALIYMLPAIIGRNKKSAVAITLVNIFFGWTIIIWVICLIWACEAKED